jgi:hypothetical protein
MNSWKVAAIFFAFFSLTSLKEMFHILYSPDADMVINRPNAAPISIIGTFVFICATIYFWKKSKEKKF